MEYSFNIIQTTNKHLFNVHSMSFDRLSKHPRNGLFLSRSIGDLVVRTLQPAAQYSNILEIPDELTMHSLGYCSHDPDNNSSSESNNFDNISDDIHQATSDGFTVWKNFLDQAKPQAIRAVYFEPAAVRRLDELGESQLSGIVANPDEIAAMDGLAAKIKGHLAPQAQEDGPGLYL